MTKKLVSCILTICMLLTMLPTMAWANDAVVCTHVHDTAICGYVEAVAAVECTVEGCEHNGAEGCGYVAAIEGVACNHVCDVCKPAGEPEPEQQPAQQPEQQEPVLMMSPAPVAEFDGTLDIANGSIVITATGYTQGDALEETPYTGDYTIGGDYTISGTVNASSHQIKISAGTEAINVTLQDLTVKHHNAVNSNQNVGSMYSPLQVLAGTVNLKLVGTSTLIADGKQPGFYIKNGAEAVISGTGKLTSLGGYYGAGIGAPQTGVAEAAGSLTINSGTIVAEGGAQAAGIGTGDRCTMASITINGGTVVAKGGAQAAGIGASQSTSMESVTINGGHVTAIGGTVSCGIGHAREKYNKTGYLNTLTITGGTIVCSGNGGASAFVAKTKNITGGNFICDPYPTVTDRSIAEIYFAGADENTLVSIKEGEAKAWSAYCDENGIVNAYLLDNDKVSFTASVGGDAKTVYKFATGKFTVGAECSCVPTTFDWAGTADTAKVYNKDVTIPVTVDVNKCGMAFHKIGDVTWTLDSVKVGNETAADASSYATADTDASTVTLKPQKGEYTVVLKAALDGHTGAELANATKEIKVTADKDAYEINIGNGPVTVEAEATTGPFTYKQNGVALYEDVSATAKVVITGTYSYNTANINAIYIKDCSPTIVFENVTISDAGNPANRYLSTILIEGTDDIEDHVTLLISGINSVIRKTNKSNAREYCGIEIRNAELTIDCIDGATCNGENCPHKLIVKSNLGDQKGAVIGSRASESSAGFTLNIDGGQIEVSTSGGKGTAIGTGINATSSNEVNINIKDGYVEAVAHGDGTAIGAGKNSVQTTVSVVIEGGKVVAEAKSENICRNNITLSGGATINDTALPEDMGTTTIPAGMVGEVETDETTGAVILPAGAAVKNDDGSYTVLLDEGSVDSEGNLDSETPTATVETPDNKPVVGNANGTFTIPAGSTVNGAEIPAEAGIVTVPTDKLDEVKPGTTEGTVVLPEGTVIENADGSTTTLPDGGTVDANGKVTSDGAVITEKTDGSVTVTEGDAVTTITPPAGEDVTVNPDGTVEVPAGSEIQTGDGEPTTIPEDAGTVILPADKVDEVKPGTTEGTVVLPEGTVIENADGSTTTLPDGGTVDANGKVTSDGAVITEKTDGSVTVTEGDAVTTITPPAGEDVTVNPDGTVDVPAGSEVQTGDGDPTTIPEGTGTVTLPADKLDEVTTNADGSVNLPAGTTVTKPDGSSSTITNGGTVDKNGTVTETLTYRPGGYYPSYTPTVTPSVDSSSLNNAAQAVGNAINKGNAELKPATGYTKEDIAKLQKEGKLNLTIEKKSGYASVADKNLIDAAIKKAGGAVSGTSVLYFDITPVLKTDDGKVVATVTDTEKPLTITLDLSADLQKAAKDGKHIAVVRCHDGKATFIDGKLNAAKTKITFSSADFSTYAVVALEKQTSAQTFDAGIVVYAGMAVLAATGSAVVIGKKRK